MIAASTDPERAPAEALTAFLAKLTSHVRAFDSEEARAKDNVEFIKEKFGYPEEDVVVSCFNIVFFGNGLWSLTEVL